MLNRCNEIDKNHWYTPREASEFLPVVESTVVKYLREGKLSGKKLLPRNQWHVKGTELIKLCAEFYP